MPAASLQQAHNRSTRRRAEAGNGAMEHSNRMGKFIAAIAEKVFAGGEATLEESKNLPLPCSERMRRRGERRKSGARGRKHYRPNLARHFVKGRGLMLLIRLELADPFAGGLNISRDGLREALRKNRNRLHFSPPWVGGPAARNGARGFFCVAAPLAMRKEDVNEDDLSTG
jgi:hypothetical protein